MLQDIHDKDWEIPGGGLDHGEGIEQTARREIREELGVELVRLDDEPSVIALGLHQHNYPTLKLYYWGELSGFDFKHEKKFTSKFIGRDEFPQLLMFGDESPIQDYVDKIWPRPAAPQ